MPRFSLVVNHPDLPEFVVPLEVGGTYYIGSRAGNDVVIAARDVSRRHAVLKVMDGVFQVTDLKSKNGTFVDGRRVDTFDIRCGDEVKVSSAVVVVLEENEARRPTGDHRAPGAPEPEAETEETERHLPVLDGSGLVELLERVRRGLVGHSLGPPLDWAAERSWVVGAMVLYGTADDVSLVASSGDLEGLLSDSATLRSLVARRIPRGLVEEGELGQRLLLARLSGGHLLVVRHRGQTADSCELRAIIAALDILIENAPAVAPPAAGVGDGDLPEELLSLPLPEALPAFERWRIERALALTGGDRSASAGLLGLTPSSLAQRVRRHGLG